MKCLLFHLLLTEGIIFGEDPNAARWIFSISAASTMYLGLAVLVVYLRYITKKWTFEIILNFFKLPELNDEFEDDSESFREKIKITFIQVCGLITGISIMIVLNM